jgi:hypothetical protein
MERSAVLPRLAAVAGLVALGLAAALASPGGDGGLLASRLLEAARGAGGGLRLASTVLLSLAVGAASVIVCILAVLRLLDRKSGRSDRRERYADSSKRALWSLLLIVLFTLILPRLYGGLSERLKAGTPGASPAAAPPESRSFLPSEEPATAEDSSMAAISPMAAIALAAGGALLAAGGMALMLRRGRHGASDTADIDFAALAQMAARDAAGRARRRLELGDPFRDTIIECYAAMCAIFTDRLEAGGARTEHLTAREFSARLAALGAAEPEIKALTSAFERARYSNEECGEGERTAARAALEVLERRYGGEA